MVAKLLGIAKVSPEVEVAMDTMPEIRMCFNLTALALEPRGLIYSLKLLHLREMRAKREKSSSSLFER